MLLESLPKGSGSLSYVFLIVCNISKLVPIDGPTLHVHGILVCGPMHHKISYKYFVLLSY